MLKHFCAAFLFVICLNSSFAYNAFPLLANKSETKSWDKKVLQCGMSVGALKYIQFGLNLQYHQAPKQWFSYGAGLDIALMNLKITSASDEHNVLISSMPLYVGANLYLRNNEANKKAYYAYGKYGASIGLNNRDNQKNNSGFLETGIGIQFKNRGLGSFYNRIEIGRQAYDLRGTAEGSFNSSIRYNLKYSSYLVRVAVMF